MDGRWLSINQITNVISISREIDDTVLYNLFSMTKVSARCKSHFLTPDRKRTKLTMSRENLTLFLSEPGDFLERFLNQDDCWVRYFDPEIKRKSMQWKHFSAPISKRTKVVLFSGKFMASVLGDAEGIVCMTIFKWVTLSMESTIPTYWGSYESYQEQTRMKTDGRDLVSPGQCSSALVLSSNGCCAWL